MPGHADALHQPDDHLEALQGRESPVGVPQRLPQVSAERHSGPDGRGGATPEGLKRDQAMETIILIVPILWLLDII
jgi:hypothetical protein